MNDELRLICTIIVVICTAINCAIISRDFTVRRKLKRLNKELNRVYAEKRKAGGADDE